MSDLRTPSRDRFIKAIRTIVNPAIGSSKPTDACVLTKTQLLDILNGHACKIDEFIDNPDDYVEIFVWCLHSGWLNDCIHEKHTPKHIEFAKLQKSLMFAAPKGLDRDVIPNENGDYSPH